MQNKFRHVSLFTGNPQGVVTGIFYRPGCRARKQRLVRAAGANPILRKKVDFAKGWQRIQDLQAWPEMAEFLSEMKQIFDTPEYKEWNSAFERAQAVIRHINAGKGWNEKLVLLVSVPLMKLKTASWYQEEILEEDKLLADKYLMELGQLLVL